MRHATSVLLLASLTCATRPPPPRHPNHPRHHHRRERDLLINNDEPPVVGSSNGTALRGYLLENYDKHSFPFETFWEEHRNEESGSDDLRVGLPIHLGLNFHRVFSVDVTTSVVDLIVWVRQSWKDPRLAWNPKDFGGRNSLQFWIEGGSGQAEASEIWTPDLQLWNMHTPLAESLSDAHASVSSDGTVFWSRPGHVKAVCKFEGLDDFPFDTLGCTMEIGSWAYSGLYLRPVKMDKGYTVGGSDTAGEAFAEFSLDTVDCREHIYPPYPSAPEEDWPVMFYHVTFQRAWQPYARSWMVLQIVLNLASFACFWLPPQIGERMGLAITSLLAAVASELVVAANLPAAGELTWFSKFSLLSMAFTAAALFESALVIYLFYFTGDDMVPNWYRWMQRKLQRKDAKCLAGEKKTQTVRFKRSSESAMDDSSCSSRRGSTSPKQNITKDISEASESSHYFEPANELDIVPEQPLSPESRPDFVANASVMPDLKTFQANQSIKTVLGRDADDFKTTKEMTNNVRWQRLAGAVDDGARVVFPVLFAVFLGTTFTCLREK